MTKSQHQSATRNQKLLKHFMRRAAEKNLKGIREHGGGLEHKNTLPEIMAEIMDLVNYAVEHEEQVGKLVAAAENAVYVMDKIGIHPTLRRARPLLEVERNQI
jgi:hypothetical protein